MTLDILSVVILGIVFCCWAVAILMVFSLIKSKVPLVPTPKNVVNRMIALSGIHRNLVVYDLGSGTGSILLRAAEICPENTFIGYELLRPAVWWSKRKSKFFRRKVKFYCKDFFKQDLSDADIIFCYLWPSIMNRFYTEIYPKLKPGTRVVSHGFKIESINPIYEEILGRAKIFVYRKN